MQQKEYYFYPPKNPQFFFPKEEFKVFQKFYSPYSKKSKYFWNLYKKYTFIRFWFRINEAKIPLPVSKIQKIIALKNAAFFYNAGTKGIHQTATIIAQNKKEKRFLKFTQKKTSQKLVFNEAKTLLKLNKNREISTPKLITYEIKDNFSYILTEVIEGYKLKHTHLNENILKLLLALPIEGFNTVKQNKIFAHGDFCPWNILVAENKKLALIDWEMAGDKIVGYDLFTFIFQTNFLLYPKKTIDTILEENRNTIKKYFHKFKIFNWEKHLIEFARLRIFEEKEKENFQLFSSYKKILIFYDKN